MAKKNTHQDTSWKFFKKEYAATLVALIIVAFCASALPFLGKGANAIVESTLKFQKRAVERIINKGLEDTFVGVGEISNSQELPTLIEGNDNEALRKFLIEEQQKRNLNIMLAADASGRIITRTRVTNKHDDYLINSAWGRKAMENEPFVTFEIGQGVPLILISSHPVKRGEEIVGYVAGGLAIDEEFGNKFRNEYFKNAGFALYSRENGIISGSFDNYEILETLPPIFPKGGDWIEGEKIYGEVSFEGTHYFVSNIPLKGIEENAGGALFFIPIPHESAALIVAIVALLLFLFASRGIYKNYMGEKARPSRVWIALTIVLSLFVLSGSFMLSKLALDRRSISVEKPIYTIYNSTLSLSPESAVLSQRAEHRILVSLSSGGEAINTVKAVLHFDPSRLEILEILTDRSFCEPWTFLEKSINNASGTVRIACVMPSPGFSATNGTLAELVVHSQDGTSAEITYDREKTMVFANDGLGTNVLRAMTDGSYRFIDPYTSPSELILFSPTHPNETRWYSRPNATFAWSNTEKGALYRMALTRSPKAPEDISRKQASLERRRTYSNLPDGEYYFHLEVELENGKRERKSYRILIDTTPPEYLIVKASNMEIAAGEMIRLEFEGRDALSGMQKNFYLRADRGIFLPVGSPLFTTFPSGKHEITIRAFDHAENFTENSLKIHVRDLDYRAFLLRILLPAFAG